MTTPDPRPNDPGSGGTPRVSRELSSLLENWFERGEQACEEQLALEQAKAFGFLRRTAPGLVDRPEWNELRARIETQAGALLASEQLRADLLRRLRAELQRAEGELAECVQGFRATPDRRWKSVESRVDLLRVAQLIDDAILAACLPVGTDAAAERDAGPGAEGLAAYAALHGEMFHPIEGWFRAMLRSVDPSLLPDAHFWRRTGLASDDRALAASAAWLQSAHARIREYKLETAETDAGSDLGNSWTLQLSRDWARAADQLASGQLPSEPLRTSSEGRLLHSLLRSVRPLLAAASTDADAGDASSLEWEDDRSSTVARCMFDAGRQQKALTIAFYSQDGRPSRALDGFSANWLGATTTIADATATFETQQIIASSEPRDVLRRCALLFVGGHRWTPSFGNTPVDELDDGDDA